MDEGHRRQSSIAAPRSGYSNGGRGTTAEKEKKRRTGEADPRSTAAATEKKERDKAAEKEIILEATRKQDTTRAAANEEYKREQKMMEALREKDKKDKLEFMNDQLKTLSYTDKEIDDIINKGRKSLLHHERISRSSRS
jgi:hypothetical protein